MHVLKKVGIAAGLVAAAAMSMTFAVPASADTAARNGDIVGVGSDTVQNAMDFLLDGGNGYAGGYNGQNNLNRAFNFFSTGDANGRAVYDGTCGAVQSTTGLGQNCSATTNQTANSLPGTVVLRDGYNPVVRPNGSGGGAAALIADAPGGPGYQGLPNGSIQFARMSRLPNGTEESNCPTSGACGGLHIYQIATDQLAIAHVTSGFDGPATLTPSDLVKIYTCQVSTWNQVGGTSTATIHPLIPQSGSGTRNFFLSDLASANNGTTPTPGTCVRTVQEHDPTGIYADSSPADAIEPFSAGKLALINSGYFSNAGYSGTSFAHGAYTANYLTTETGAGSYNSTRGLYVVIRNSDLASTTPFQPGGTLNWAQTLFDGPSSYVARASSAAALSAAGFTPAYVNCGVNVTGC